MNNPFNKYAGVVKSENTAGLNPADRNDLVGSNPTSGTNIFYCEKCKQQFEINLHPDELYGCPMCDHHPPVFTPVTRVISITIHNHIYGHEIRKVLIPLQEYEACKAGIKQIFAVPYHDEWRVLWHDYKEQKFYLLPQNNIRRSS